MRQSNNLKNAVVKSIASRLVARDNSCHYWIFSGSKWVRYGLHAIAHMLHMGTVVISAMFRMANSSVQAAKHLPVSELATYAVLFVVLLVLSVVLVINAITLAEIKLSAIPVIFMAITGACTYDTLTGGVKHE